MTCKCLTQRGPSYMAVMLYMTDVVDGFPFTPHFILLFYPLQSHYCTCQHAQAFSGMLVANYLPCGA